MSKKLFWIFVGESFKKTFLEQWIFTSDDSSDEQGFTNFPMLIQSIGNTYYIRDDDPPTPTPAREPDSLPWELTRTIHLGQKIITVLTRCRPIVFELIYNCNDCNFTRRRFVELI